MPLYQSESVSGVIERAMQWAEHKPRFTSIEDGSTDARRARIAYDARRRNVLEALDWNFARHRVLTGQVANAVPPVGMPYAYSLPQNCLRVRNVMAGGQSLTWRREANIYSNCEADQIIYTIDELNPAVFPPSMVLALEYLLAAQFAMVYARSVNRSNLMLENYRRAMIEADQMEGSERSNDDAYEAGPLDLALGSFNFRTLS